MDPSTPTADHWRTLIAEDPEAVLEDVAILDDPRHVLDKPLIAAVRTRHAVAEVLLADLGTGSETRDGSTFSATQN